MSLPNRFTATDLARRFAVEIFRLHGLPKSIISDRDPLFMSQFWKELFKLRCFTSENPRSWFRFIHLAEYWYNTSHHSAIGMSPFQALYGRPPPSIIDYSEGSATSDSINASLMQRKEIIKSLRENLKRTRQSMRDRENLHRRDVRFEPGQLVWLRLRAYRQNSVQRRPFHKLSKRYFGPFRVVRRIGAVAYELDMPAESRIHSVFHVSLLRPYRNSETMDATSSAKNLSEKKEVTLLSTENSNPTSFKWDDISSSSALKPSSPVNTRVRVLEGPQFHSEASRDSKLVSGNPTDTTQASRSQTVKSTPLDLLTKSLLQSEPSTTNTTNPLSQSEPPTTNTIRVTGYAPIQDQHVADSNLADKVISEGEGIVTEFTRPKRNVKRPIRYLD